MSEASKWVTVEVWGKTMSTRDCGSFRLKASNQPAAFPSDFGWSVTFGSYVAKGSIFPNGSIENAQLAAEKALDAILREARTELGAVSADGPEEVELHASRGNADIAQQEGGTT